MIEGIGVLDALYQFLSVLDVGFEKSDLGVEDVLEAMFPHELIRQDSNALFDFVFQVVVAPHLL